MLDGGAGARLEDVAAACGRQSSRLESGRNLKATDEGNYDVGRVVD